MSDKSKTVEEWKQYTIEKAKLKYNSLSKKPVKNFEKYYYTWCKENGFSWLTND